MSGPDRPPATFRATALLKEDLFGRVERGILTYADGQDVAAVRRDYGRAAWILRPLARRLASREARALRAAQDVDRIPRILEQARSHLIRTWIPGKPMQEAERPTPAYFDAARCILESLHAVGVTHNDLHKEPNLLVDPQGMPALVDFQLSSVFRRRGPWYRTYVHEDLRHLLKHKRRYCLDAVTPEEREILARPSWIARWWRRTVKRGYRFVTRRLLRWRDREGRGQMR